MVKGTDARVLMLVPPLQVQDSDAPACFLRCEVAPVAVKEPVGRAQVITGKKASNTCQSL